MAEQALHLIPNKVLKEIHRVGTLKCLLETQEGNRFFEYYSREHPETDKYFRFYVSAGVVCSTLDPEQQLDLAESCYKKYIALEACCDDRIEKVVNRARVGQVKKVLAECREKGSSPTGLLQEIRNDALGYLDQNIFRPQLIPLLREEKESRISTCILV